MSMPTMETSSRDVFVRHTGADGKSLVFAHRVWIVDGNSVPRFLLSKQDEAESANTSARKDGKPALAKAEQITEEQYKKER